MRKHCEQVFALFLCFLYFRISKLLASKITCDVHVTVMFYASSLQV